MSVVEKRKGQGSRPKKADAKQKKPKRRKDAKPIKRDSCDAKTRKGGRCTQVAGYGTEHLGYGPCKFHGGSTPNHTRAAQVAQAQDAATNLGIPVEMDPGEALWRELWECIGNVQFYRTQVQKLPTDPEQDELVKELGEDGTANYHWKRGEPGKVGRVYHVSGIPTGEAKPHVWVVLYNQERDRLRQVCSEMIKAGVEQRRLEIAERDAEILFQAQMRALEVMGLSKRLEEFRSAFASALQPTIEAGESAYLGDVPSSSSAAALINAG